MDVIADPLFQTFGRPDSSWHIDAHCGVTCIGTRVRDAMQLEIAHAQGANWHAALKYAPLRVRAGQKALLRFSAKAKIPIRFSVWIGLLHKPWSSLVTGETHFREKEMTAEWQAFEHHTDIAADADEARLIFVLGVIDNTIWLKDISLALV